MLEPEEVHDLTYWVTSRWVDWDGVLHCLPGWLVAQRRQTASVDQQIRSDLLWLNQNPVINGFEGTPLGRVLSVLARELEAWPEGASVRALADRFGVLAARSDALAPWRAVLRAKLGAPGRFTLPGAEPLELESFFEPPRLQRIVDGLPSEVTAEAVIEGEGVRMVIHGPPDAGKSQLGAWWALRRASFPDLTPVVPLSLPFEDPIAAAGLAEPDEARAALVALAQAGRVLFVVDDFEACEPAAALGALLALTLAYPKAGVVIFSRAPILALQPHFQHAALLPLDATGRRRLLVRLLRSPAAAERVLAFVGEAGAALEGELGSPLMLALLARAAQASTELPADAATLAEQALRLLLAGAPEATWDVLTALMSQLHRTGERAWPEATWRKTLASLPEKAQLKVRPGPFFAQLVQLGILMKHPNGFMGLRYFLFQERLVAEGLRDEAAQADQQRFVHTYSADGQGWTTEVQGHWEGVVAMAVGLAPDPLKALTTLTGYATRQLRARALMACRRSPEVLAPITLRLVAERQLEADILPTLLRTWTLLFGRERTTHALLAEVKPSTSLGILGALVYAFQATETPLDRADLFHRAGRRLPSTPMSTVPIRAGWFIMGSDEVPPRHPVWLSAFRMATTPFTVAHYQAYDDSYLHVGGPEAAWDGTWWEALALAFWAGGQLPTEAQWEYACRAGTTSRFWSGDTEADLARVAWFGGPVDADGAPILFPPVGAKPANPWGLFDMHGTVSAWCADRLGALPTGPCYDPTGPERGSERVVRGGSTRSPARTCQSAWRSSMPTTPNARAGLRVVFPASTTAGGAPSGER